MVGVLVWSSRRKRFFKIPADPKPEEWSSNFLSVSVAEGCFKLVKNEGRKVWRVLMRS